MAVKTWYLEEINVGGTNPNRLWWDEDGSNVPAQTTSASGWTVAKTAAGNYRILSNGQEISGGWSTTVQPTATAPVVNNSYPSTAIYTPPDLLNSTDSISSLYEYNGVFEAGTWTMDIPVIAVSSGGDQDGRITARFFKALRSGTSWSPIVELTSAVLNGSTVTNLTTTTSQISTVTWSAPAFNLENEFLIVNIAWNITGAGGANTRDVRIRYGTGATLVSPNFKIKRHILT